MSIAMRRVSSPQHRSLGVTLIELLVAVAVGMLLIAGVIQIFVGNSQTYRFNESLSRIQENGRFAIEEITRDVRMAGYYGCARRTTTVNNTLVGMPASFDPMVGIQGWEATNTAVGDALTLDFGAATANVTGGGWASSGTAPINAFQAVPESDILRIWRGEEVGARLIATGAGTATTVANPRFSDGDLVLLSDCLDLDIIRACTVVTGGGESELDMNGGCIPGSNVSLGLRASVGGLATRLTGSIYYVGKRGDNADAPPALFRRRLNGNGLPGAAEELVEGVENIQILYGVDTTNNGQLDAYVSGAAVADWQDVLAVRINLLLVSLEDNLVDPGQQIQFNGPQNPGDRRLRQNMTTTIALRNRTL